MKLEEDQAAAGTSVDYDGPPITEQQLDGMEYRVDAGRGSAVAVSQRRAGEWTWVLAGEGRWDGVRLRVKGLGHPVVESLGRALLQAMRDTASGLE